MELFSFECGGQPYLVSQELHAEPGAVHLRWRHFGAFRVNTPCLQLINSCIRDVCSILLHSKKSWNTSEFFVVYHRKFII